MEIRSRLEKISENPFAEEFYFVMLALILAFGILQSTGAALDTDRPVVSVVTCSMYPQLHVGDILIVRGTSFEDIEEEEIVVYSTKKTEITIDGQKYSLVNYGEPEPVQTSAGEVKLLNVRNVNDTVEEDPVKAAEISVDGWKRVVVEGESFDAGDSQATIGSAEGVSIPVVHRVLEKRENSLSTKGDNNRGQLPFEREILPRQIHGKLAFKIPRIGGLKILAMDLVGFNGDKPLVIDAYRTCTQRT